MNEKDWLEYEHPYYMLEYLRRARRYRPTRRKIHLYSCRCVRRIRGSLIYEESEQAIFVAERFADGNATAEQLHAARVAAQRAVHCATRDGERCATCGARAAVALTHDPPDNFRAIPLVLNRAHRIIRHIMDSLPESKWNAERQAQADILRCIFGNPFAKVAIERGWLTLAVVDLACGIYDKRAFKTLPILADALEEAGCTTAEILQHCRGPGSHGRGCWVVDQILGKK